MFFQILQSVLITALLLSTPANGKVNCKRGMDHMICLPTLDGLQPVDAALFRERGVDLLRCDYVPGDFESSCYYNRGNGFLEVGLAACEDDIPETHAADFCDDGIFPVPSP